MKDFLSRNLTNLIFIIHLTYEKLSTALQYDAIFGRFDPRLKEDDQFQDLQTSSLFGVPFAPLENAG